MMRSIQSVAAKMLYEMDGDSAPDFLRNHPGNGIDIIGSAVWRLRKHPRMQSLTLAEFAEIEKILLAEYGKAQTLCESPIERDMLAALMSGCWGFCDSPFVPVHSLRDKEAPIKDAPVVIIPQFPFGRFRLDFAILCRGEGKPRILAVECDGKEFHDPEADRLRDKQLEAFGIDVFRATGKSINAAVYDIADLVIQAVGVRL